MFAVMFPNIENTCKVENLWAPSGPSFIIMHAEGGLTLFVLRIPGQGDA